MDIIEELQACAQHVANVRASAEHNAYAILCAYLLIEMKTTFSLTRSAFAEQGEQKAVSDLDTAIEELASGDVAVTIACYIKSTTTREEAAQTLLEIFHEVDKGDLYDARQHD